MECHGIYGIVLRPVILSQSLPVSPGRSCPVRWESCWMKASSWSVKPEGPRLQPSSGWRMGRSSMIRGAWSSGSAATRGRKQKSFGDFTLWERCYGNFCYGDDVILVFSISEDGSTLTLNGAHTSDSGKYTCVATNPAGEEDRIFNLNVYGKFIGFYFLLFLLHFNEHYILKCWTCI